MKNILLITLFILFSTKAWTQEWEWGMKASGDSQDPYDPSTEIHVDYNGNIVIAGYYQQNLGFDTLSIYTEDDYYSDIFICRINSNKKVEWLKHIESGSSYGDDIGLTVDDDQFIYLSGSYSGKIFVSKYDSLGHLIWHQNFNNEYSGYGRTISVDQFDNVYVAGGSGWTFYMAKLDYYGNTIWKREQWMNYSAACELTDITVDAIGNVYFIGVFGIDSLALDDIKLVHDGGWGDDTFFGKLDANGNFNWIKSSSGRTNNNPQIALSPDNYLYLSGSLYSGITFDTIDIEGICCQNPTPYIAKYDTDGNIIWAKGAFTTYGKKGLPYDIKVDYNSNLYLTGTYYTTSGSGENESYLEEYNSSGEHLWRMEMNMGSSDYSHAIDIDNYGYLYNIGFNKSANFIDENQYSSVRNYGIGILNTNSSTLKRTKRPSIERLHFICPDSQVDTLYAQGTNIQWYNDPLLNNQVHVGNSYVPDISISDTFYVTQTVNDIESWPKEVIIHFSELLNTTLHFSNDTLYVNDGTYFTYQWYMNGDSIKKGNEKYIVVDTIGTFSVNIKEGVCEKWIDTTMVATSIEKNLIEENLLLFPNPASDGIINFVIRTNSVERINIRIINLNGLIIENKELTNQNGLIIERINLSDYSSGIYFVSVYGGGLNITKKILIH